GVDGAGLDRGSVRLAGGPHGLHGPRRGRVGAEVLHPEAGDGRDAVRVLAPELDALVNLAGGGADGVREGDPAFVVGAALDAVPDDLSAAHVGGGRPLESDRAALQVEGGGEVAWGGGAREGDDVVAGGAGVADAGLGLGAHTVGVALAGGDARVGVRLRGARLGGEGGERGEWGALFGAFEEVGGHAWGWEGVPLGRRSSGRR